VEELANMSDQEASRTASHRWDKATKNAYPLSESLSESNTPKEIYNVIIEVKQEMNY
jgi:hypothetical protein